MKSWAIFLLLLGSTAVAAGQSMEHYIHLTDSFKKTGQVDKLIPVLLREIKVHPGNEYALRTLGGLYFEQHRPEEGERYFKEAIKIDPLCARCYMSMGIAAAMRNENGRAMENLNRAIGCDPGDAGIYSVRASLNELLGNSQEALFDYNMAIYIDPRNASNYLQRGTLNGKAGFFYLALADFDKAAELDTANYLVLFSRATLYFGKKMFKEAFADINRAISLDSTHAFLFSARGNFYSDVNDFGKAIADYNYAVKLDAKDYHLLYNRALCYYALQDMNAYCEDIHECYRILSAYAPGDSLKIQLDQTLARFCDSARENYYYHRGIALFNQHRYKEAIEMYTTAIQKFPASSLIRILRANAYLVLKDYSHAIPDYTKAIGNKENIGNDLRESGIQVSSEDTYINGLFATTWLSLSQSEFALGNYSAALVDINQGIGLAPVLKEFGKENYYNMRGIILITMGRQEEASRDFDTSLALNPAFETAWVNRSVAKVTAGNGENPKAMAVKTDESLALNVNWELPDRKSGRHNSENLASALEDCNRALQLNPADAYACYVRGRLEKLLGFGNYCIDLLKSKGMGFPVEAKYLKDCGE